MNNFVGFVFVTRSTDKESVSTVQEGPLKTTSTHYKSSKLMTCEIDKNRKDLKYLNRPIYRLHFKVITTLTFKVWKNIYRTAFDKIEKQLKLVTKN